MLVRECDRCKKRSNQYNAKFGWTRVNRTSLRDLIEEDEYAPITESGATDLCGDCSKSLLLWLKEGPLESA